MSHRYRNWRQRQQVLAAVQRGVDGQPQFTAQSQLEAIRNRVIQPYLEITFGPMGYEHASRLPQPRAEGSEPISHSPATTGSDQWGRASPL